MRWYVEPLAYDQRSFNAAALRLIDDLEANHSGIKERLIDNGDLRRFVNVGDDFHAEGFLQLFEDLHPFFQARTAVRVDGRTVGFVERGFENVRNAQFLRHGDVVLADAHRQIARFQHVHTAKQHKRQVVCYVDVANANHFLFHAFAFVKVVTVALQTARSH